MNKPEKMRALRKPRASKGLRSGVRWRIGKGSREDGQRRQREGLRGLKVEKGTCAGFTVELSRPEHGKGGEAQSNGVPGNQQL